MDDSDYIESDEARECRQLLLYGHDPHFVELRRRLAAAQANLNRYTTMSAAQGTHTIEQARRAVDETQHQLAYYIEHAEAALR